MKERKRKLIEADLAQHGPSTEVEAESKKPVSGPTITWTPIDPGPDPDPTVRRKPGPNPKAKPAKKKPAKKKPAKKKVAKKKKEVKRCAAGVGRTNTDPSAATVPAPEGRR